MSNEGRPSIQSELENLARFAADVNLLCGGGSRQTVGDDWSSPFLNVLLNGTRGVDLSSGLNFTALSSSSNDTRRTIQSFIEHWVTFAAGLTSTVSDALQHGGRNLTRDSLFDAFLNGSGRAAPNFAEHFTGVRGMSNESRNAMQSAMEDMRRLVDELHFMIARDGTSPFLDTLLNLANDSVVELALNGSSRQAMSNSTRQELQNAIENL